MPKRLLKPIGIGLTGGALLTAALVDVMVPKSDVGYSASHDSRFPPGATDISYNITRGALGGWWNADFRISEADFVSYADRMDWKLENLTKAQDFRVNLAPGKLELKEISDGLVYESPVADNGGGVVAVFDRSSGRAMIRSSSN